MEATRQGILYPYERGRNNPPSSSPHMTTAPYSCLLYTSCNSRLIPLILPFCRSVSTLWQNGVSKGTPFGTRLCGAKFSVLYALSALPRKCHCRRDGQWHFVAAGKRAGFTTYKEKIVARFHQPTERIWKPLAYVILPASGQLVPKRLR